MKAKITVLVIILLILPNLVCAARVHGTIYDFDLNKAENSIVEISTIPKQSFVSKDGTYSFTVSLGNYTIKASQDSDTAQENVVIKDEGEYIMDLILFPDLSKEEEILDEAELDVTADYFDEEDYTAYYLAGLIFFMLLILAGVLYYYKQLRKQIKEEIKEIKQVENEEKVVAADLNEILDFIKKEGGRTTQKDIRRNFPQSEAKVSLMIAELEELGKIKKIKKGRGNIIALK